MSVMNCVTHHHGCDCREAEIASLIGEVMDSHSYLDSEAYQECDKDPCKWCQRAKEIGFSSSLDKGGKKEDGYLKYSRAYGLMWLRSYASGDGSISFNWVLDSDRNGRVLDEGVTESDVSEYLRKPGMEKKWVGWDIIDIGSGKNLNVKLVRNVERPFHTSKQLVLEGVQYRYDMKFDGTHHDAHTTSFFEGRSTVVIEDSTIIGALCFFLNNEEAFDRRRGLT